MYMFVYGHSVLFVQMFLPVSMFSCNILWIFVYFPANTYVVGTQKNHLNEMVLLNNQKTC